ncbi:MAG: GDP-mannose 4,6-dehydratase [Armatimonadetes bacterium]|nr:GDP-mannose 4,6-dehydratase [Armatimonadota bacterium]
MKILVTGGAGFIGSHLTELLLHEGHTVTVIDNLVTGRSENLQHLKGHPNLEFIIDTVLNEERMRHLVPHHDIVMHLAAAVGVRWIIENPLLSIETNIRATEVVLEAAETNGTKVLLASTSEVYGKNEKVPLTEDDDSIIGATQITRWLYANTKATDEFLALAYYRDRKLPVVIVRYFNTVGPRQTGRYGMVVPRFVRQALNGEPLTVYGNGEQARCFTDVRDAVRATAELAMKPEAVGEVFNIGNPREISIRALAELIIRMTGSRSTIRYVPYSEAYPAGFEDMRRRVPGVEKLRQLLGWAPRIPLEENLARIIDAMRTEVMNG